MLNDTDRNMLKIAYNEARLGFEAGGCPIGSVLARGGQEVSRGHNQRVQQGDPIAMVRWMLCVRLAVRKPTVTRYFTRRSVLA